MSDTRPTNCRFRLEEEGKAYPRSGCEGCGKSIFNGIPGCPRRENPEIAALRARAEKAEAERDETYIDETGTTWVRPTAEAYYRACKALDTIRARAETAEARVKELEAVIRHAADYIENRDKEPT